MKNTICWVDIPVKKLARSIKFYSAVLGAKVKREKIPGCEFGVLPHRGSNVSACLIDGKEHRPSKTGPLIYLNVDGRLDKAIKAARKGGKILKDKHAIGSYGFRAVILDSEGNRVALHSSKA